MAIFSVAGSFVDITAGYLTWGMPGTIGGGVPFSQALSGAARVTVPLANAEDYTVTYNFQSNPGVSDGLRRLTVADDATAADNIIIQSENGPGDEGLIVAGRYWPT